jgi:hypothetical protein
MLKLIIKMSKLTYIKTFESFSIKNNQDLKGIDEGLKDTIKNVLAGAAIGISTFGNPNTAIAQQTKAPIHATVNQNTKQDNIRDFAEKNQYFDIFTGDYTKDLMKGASVYAHDTFAAISFKGGHPMPGKYTFAVMFDKSPASCEIIYSFDDKNQKDKVMKVINNSNLGSRVIDLSNSGARLKLTGIDLTKIENIVRELNKI